MIIQFIAILIMSTWLLRLLTFSIGSSLGFLSLRPLQSQRSISQSRVATINSHLADLEIVPRFESPGMTDRAVHSNSQNATATAAIELLWQRIRPEMEYLTEEELKLAKFGLKVAYLAHDGQVRKSGEPFIIHPVAVAGLLAGELRVDCDTVLAGLLHDTVEDTELTFLQLELLFGRTVRRIVEGETKVSKLPKIALMGGRGEEGSGGGGGGGGGSSGLDEQAENLRQMFIAMSTDYRIIIVKLADRLHNMRTLQHMSPHKQQRISRETIDIFAPLAHRLGIWNFKSELEDLSFGYLHPSEYRSLATQLNNSKQYKESLERSQAELEETLRKDAILLEQEVNVTVTGRLKELYPLWTKMREGQKKRSQSNNGPSSVSSSSSPPPPSSSLQSSMSTHQLPSDVVALRVILDLARRPDESEDEWKTRGVWLCYHVLGLVSHLQVQESADVSADVSDAVAGAEDNSPSADIASGESKATYNNHHPPPAAAAAAVVPPPFSSPQVKDYISFPKPNGYQSLHTAINVAVDDANSNSNSVVVGGGGQTVEVQIRTNWMHSVAEFGMAAHWLYKEDRYGSSSSSSSSSKRVKSVKSSSHTSNGSGGGGGTSSGSNSIFNWYQVAWMESIKDWQDEIHNSTEFVEAIRKELLGKRVFIFLRDGKILNLSRGATVTDASFAIHSEIGLKMVAAEINGQPVPFNYTLQNGDVVSILTSDEGQPSHDWMQFAKSRSTRAKLRTFFNRQQ